MDPGWGAARQERVEWIHKNFTNTPSAFKHGGPHVATKASS